MIEIAQRGRVLEIHLNRPEKRNALDLATCHELVKAFDGVDHDRGIGAILLAGNGTAFCAGMDLGESLEAAQSELSAIHERLFTTIHRIRTPIVAAVHGAALAGGLGLAANAHIVIAYPKATFGLTEVKVGLWPVLVYRAVEHALGERRTLELALTGRLFDAAQAKEYGLVQEIAKEPLGRALQIAEQLAASSPVAIESGLDYVHQIRGRDWDQAGRIGRAVRDRLLQSADYKEGVAAFLEKRQPSWPSLGG